MGTFKGVKWSGCDSGQTPLYTTKFKNEWNYTSASLIYQHDVDRDKCSNGGGGSSKSSSSGVVLVVVVVVPYLHRRG